METLEIAAALHGKLPHRCTTQTVSIILSRRRLPKEKCRRDLMLHVRFEGSIFCPTISLNLKSGSIFWCQVPIFLSFSGTNWYVERLMLVNLWYSRTCQALFMSVPPTAPVALCSHPRTGTPPKVTAMATMDSGHKATGSAAAGPARDRARTKSVSTCRAATSPSASCSEYSSRVAKFPILLFLDFIEVSQSSSPCANTGALDGH
jgi:hypothetical protein